MRSARNFRTSLLIVGSLVSFPTAALAQDNTVVGNTTVATDTIDPALNAPVVTGTDPLLNDTAAQPVREERDNDFPWGLLGLLGLAGLLGRKKKHDIHIDARNDRRNV
nr:WGxxGxxG family protein [uncultured Sphingomonas sp.]